MRNVMKIGVVCLVVSMFVACGDKDKCKEVNSNFETEYVKYNALHKQFDEHLEECKQIEGFEEAYLYHLPIGALWVTSLSSVVNVYNIWKEDIDIWSNLTDSQQKLITDTYNTAIKTREQGNICQGMVNDNPDCLGDIEEFNGKC